MSCSGKYSFLCGAKSILAILMKRLLPLALACVLGLCIMSVSCTSTSDTGSEEMLPGKWIPVQYYADGEWYGCYSPVWYFMFNDNGTEYEGSWTVESLSSGELTISTDDLDFADYGKTKIRMTRD